MNCNRCASLFARYQLGELFMIVINKRRLKFGIVDIFEIIPLILNIEIIIYTNHLAVQSPHSYITRLEAAPSASHLHK